MFAGLTDVLSCPRCGPEHGLVLLADRVEPPRVLEGTLGCPSCHERYPITAGFADLRTSPNSLPGAEDAPEPGGGEAAVRLAALLGVGQGLGHVLIAGEAARFAPGIAALVEGLEVVAIDEALAGWPEEAGVSRLAADASIPFRTASMRGVVLSGVAADAMLEEGARVAGMRGRLVLEDAPESAEERLANVGLGVAAREGRTLVATRG